MRIATPVFATLRYDCHWQSLLFSIRCAEHRWFAMTVIVEMHRKNDTERCPIV